MLDALAQHHLVEDLATRHADKRVVHCGRAVLLQGLDLGVVMAIEGGRRSGARLRLRGGGGGALGALGIFVGDFGRERLGRAAVGRDGGRGRGGGEAAGALESADGSRA